MQPPEMVPSPRRNCLPSGPAPISEVAPGLEIASRSTYAMLTVIQSLRSALTLRSIGVAAALSVASGGTGLPMCATLIAEATAPCPMHSAHPGPAPAAGTPVATMAAASGGQACHQESGPGCQAGSACPTSGPAMPTLGLLRLVRTGASHTGLLGPVTEFTSFFAPPLAPPPQA